MVVETKKRDQIMTPVYTGLALIAFASNSVICRLALITGSIDPAGFSIIRLLSGALVLTLITSIVKDEKLVSDSGNWLSACTLFLYVITFSFAYVTLSACTGALILFGSVQGTMILTGLVQDERPKILEIAGLSVALVGLIYLMLPGWEIPSLRGAILMTTAGVSWGIYSLQGKNEGNPITVTRGNFTRAIPFALVAIIVYLTGLNASFSGVFYAFISGALTSGVGYVVWYAALRGLTVTQAATIQLLVPIIATIGGVIFLSEIISLRLVLSSVLILGGVGFSLFAGSH